MTDRVAPDRPGDGPTLDAEERAAFERGVAEFNGGYYFECHDTLEDLWAGLRGPSRDFFQGLIQVSVAFYHLGNDNPVGAASMFERALKRFEGYPDRYFGFDLAGHRGEVEAWLARARGRQEDLATERPSWKFDRVPSAPREERPALSEAPRSGARDARALPRPARPRRHP